MVRSDELMSSIIRYGRGSILDFVARSQSVDDTLNYIQAERFLEVINLASYVTTDLISFEKKNGKS